MSNERRAIMHNDPKGDLYLQKIDEDAMKVYLIQSNDVLRDTAIQNAIIVAESKEEALKQFVSELRENPDCDQNYRPEWFECQEISVSRPSIRLQYGGETWQFSEVTYE
ncbi:hypothetical protein [Lactobacillus taiwanensis]|uniref:hypothetical protein n=1 Tax=Lactobacillus taiwanensis TaxID=508451 RepID=UPI0032201362